MLRPIAGTSAVLLLLAAPLGRAHDGPQTPKPPEAATAEASFEARLRALEEREAELYHTLAEKKEADGLGLAERLTISSLLEVEASASRIKFAGGKRASSSDLVLATAQLGFGLKINEWVNGDLSFLFEEDVTDLEVDEAAINLSRGAFSARVGRQYLPFGVFYSHFITDPLTLELGETRETAFLSSYEYGPAKLSAFVFNGDAEKAGEGDHLRDWGASLVVTPLEGLRLGGSWLSDLADSNAELLGGAEYRRRVGGWSLFAILERGAFGLSGELLGAARTFAAADLDADGSGGGDKPFAWNVEAAWLPREDLEVALRYEASRQFAGQPTRQYGVDVSWSPWKAVTLSVEYLRGHFRGAFAGDELVNSSGSPAKTRDVVTTQLALQL
ncbi:MAG: LbtU family siderophore porin [Deltaproteobacteria bacterium]|nr:LbtU family siderophore porin [Deltaproteobacteria bacterium]